MLKDLRRFKRKRTWIKVHMESGKYHVGIIKSLSGKVLLLVYRVKENMRCTIKISQIESVEYLSCENAKVWTTE